MFHCGFIVEICHAKAKNEQKKSRTRGFRMTIDDKIEQNADQPE